MTPKDIIARTIDTTSVHAPASITAERILAELAQAGFAIVSVSTDIERLRREAVYECPVCGSNDESAYARCMRPDCPDGRDIGVRGRVNKARIRLDDLANPNRAKCVA